MSAEEGGGEAWITGPDGNRASGSVFFCDRHKEGASGDETGAGRIARENAP